MGERGPAQNLEIRASALALRLDGLTFAEIGAKLGLSRQRIQQILSPPRDVRDFVVKRARGLCQRCGIAVGTSGHVHHRRFSEMMEGAYNDRKNLRLLCPSCHRVEHKLPYKFERHNKRIAPLPSE